MGKSTKAGKAKGGPKQVPLAAVNFVPTLAKPTHAVGDFIALLGGEWPGCPASDKTKLLGAMGQGVDAQRRRPRPAAILFRASISKSLTASTASIMMGLPFAACAA